MPPPRWREAAAALAAAAGLTFVLWRLRGGGVAVLAAASKREDEGSEGGTGATAPRPPLAAAAGTAAAGLAAAGGSAAPASGQEAAASEGGPPLELGDDAWKQGDVAVIQGLRAKPAFNGLAGTLERFLPDKGRWAVRLHDGEEPGGREPLLVRAENLARAPAAAPPPPSPAELQAALGLPPPPQLRAPAAPRPQPVRELPWKGQTVRLFGVPTYTSSVGCDEVFRELEDFRPGVVLMESFDVGEDIEVEPGDPLPYRPLLGSGLGAALRDVGDRDFRRVWSTEAVAVLAALRIGAELRLCDRLHVASFDRIIAHHGLDELKLRLLQATEAIASFVEQQVSREAAEARKAKRKPKPVGFSDLPQNSLCPFFEELGTERRRVMAHFAVTAAEQASDVLLVVGAEHVAEVEAILAAGGPGDGAQELLGAAGGDGGAAVEEESDWRVELEKRALMAAFLNSTRTFPPEVVLLPREQLLPEYAEQVSKIYPRYREMFMGRLSSALAGAGGQQQLQEAMAAEIQRPRVRGLAQLHDLRNG